MHCVLCLAIQIERKAYFQLVAVYYYWQSNVQLTMWKYFVTEIQPYRSTKRLSSRFAYRYRKVDSHRKVWSRKFFEQTPWHFAPLKSKWHTPLVIVFFSAKYSLANCAGDIYFTIFIRFYFLCFPLLCNYFICPLTKAYLNFSSTRFGLFVAT